MLLRILSLRDCLVFSHRDSDWNCKLGFWNSSGGTKKSICTFKMTDTNSSEVKGSHSQWDDISCPVCMDHPHNAVLIICSSHDKGCKSYICDTSYRHSNCLDRFKQLHSNNEDLSTSTSNNNNMKCPLCRGSVIGWMVVKEVREYLNLKSRICTSDSCSFSGSYKELRRHAREVHPTTRPSDVDPMRQRAWLRLENESEHGDVISALRSEMPGALVLGDYVIDSSTLFLLDMFNSQVRSRAERRRSSSSSSSSIRWRSGRRFYMDESRSMIRRRRRRRFVRSRHDEQNQH